MEEFAVQLRHTQAELTDLKNAKEQYEYQLNIVNNRNLELQRENSELDYAILKAQSDLDRRNSERELAKEINGYCMYVQDVSKRWIGHFHKSLVEYPTYLDAMMPPVNEIKALAQQFVDIKTQILESKDPNCNWDQETIMKYVDDVVNTIRKESRGELKEEREELNALQRKIDDAVQLLQYTVNETQLEPPMFNINEAKPIESVPLDSLRKFNQVTLEKIPGEREPSGKKGGQPEDVQVAGPSHGGQSVNYRHHQEQFQAQEIRPEESYQTYGEIEKVGGKAAPNRCMLPKIEEEPEQKDELPAQSARNFMKFGDNYPRRSDLSFKNPFEDHQYARQPPQQQERDQRKRKMLERMALDKKIDVLEEDSPDYVEEDGDNREPKKGRFESQEKSPRFESGYFDRNFLDFPSSAPNSQQLESLFPQTQDLPLDFFSLDNDRDEDEESIKPAFL